MNVTKSRISLRVSRDLADDKDLQLKPGSLCILNIKNHKLAGSLSSVTERKDKMLILLKFDRDFHIVESIFHSSGGNDSDCSLLVEEKVPAELFDKAEKMLSDLSEKTGKSKQELLIELTSERGRFEGREDLRFVSETQMHVIIDKMRKQLSESVPA